MNWHLRYAQQAKWTQDLRDYIFKKIKLNEDSRVLEVGCGTGAILSGFSVRIPLYAVDLDSAALAECRLHAPSASIARGNALFLPYPNIFFDVVYCHFLLLWLSDPLQALLEMKRVTKPGGHIIAFAEPDYLARIDKPNELVQLGKWQTAALIRQGADPGLGIRLAELFFQAGIKLNETGTIQDREKDTSTVEEDIEWAVLESDLVGFVKEEDLQNMRILDRQARARGERVLHVPTYFAWGNP